MGLHPSISLTATASPFLWRQRQQWQPLSGSEMAAARARLPGSTACRADQPLAATGALTRVGKMKHEAQSAWSTVSLGSSLFSGTCCPLPSSNSRLQKADSYLLKKKKKGKRIGLGGSNLQRPLNSVGTSFSRRKHRQLPGQVLLPQTSSVISYRDLYSLTASWLAPLDHRLHCPAGRIYCFGMLRQHPSHRHPVVNLRARI